VRRVVSLESIAGHEAVLSAGLRAGERLVVDGQRDLQDGSPLRTVAEEPAGAEAPAAAPRG
jgi:hypothetical protein